MFRKLLLAVAALLLLPVLLVAQDGKLRGKVTDKESGEALIGANVTVEGTNLGAATDVNGEYVILSVPPGIHGEGDVYRLFSCDVFKRRGECEPYQNTELCNVEFRCAGSGG